MNILIGILAGAAASMGLGGGFFLLVYLTMFTNIPQETAQAVNILFFLPIALLSLYFHSRNKMIEWKTVRQYSLSGIAGVLTGTAAAYFIDSSALRKLFAVFLIIVAVKEIFHKNKKSDDND